MTSIKYAHIQVMGIINGKFHQNALKTVGGVAETMLCLLTDGRTDEPKSIVPFDLRRGTNSHCDLELDPMMLKRKLV